MTLFVIIALCGLLTFFTLRVYNSLLSLVAAISWIFLFVYTRENPIGGVAEGSFSDELIVWISWGMVIVILIMGITRYRRNSSIRRGNLSYTENGLGEITNVTHSKGNNNKGLMELSPDEYRATMRARRTRNRRR